MYPDGNVFYTDIKKIKEMNDFQYINVESVDVAG
jgi:hypothetical protein